MLSGWNSEIEQDAVVDLFAHHGVHPRAQIVAFVEAAAAGPVVRVTCPVDSLAQELASSARAHGAICYCVTENAEQ